MSQIEAQQPITSKLRSKEKPATQLLSPNGFSRTAFALGLTITTLGVVTGFGHDIIQIPAVRELFEPQTLEQIEMATRIIQVIKPFAYAQILGGIVLMLVSPAMPSKKPPEYY